MINQLVRPELWRIPVEETIYLNAFTDAISSSLRSPDTDFVRCVSSKAGIQRQFNARFIESVTPIVTESPAVGHQTSGFFYGTDHQRGDMLYDQGDG